MRARRLPSLIGLIALALALVPVFQVNLLGSSDTAFFQNWDRDSQAIVLGGIERSEIGAPESPWTLFVAQPQIGSPYATFDTLEDGATPTATSYVAYTSSLELQGHLFQAAYGLGCSSVTCLETLESTLFSFTLVAFLAALAVVTRRSLALVALGSAVLSPWVVASAHNLYWVPWTWLLPAVAACFVAGARTRRGRVIAVIAVGVGTGLKAGTGYEFLTTTTLLAASIPILAHLLGRRRDVRSVTKDVAAVFAASIAAFLVVLTIHALVSGSGSLVIGLQHIAEDAMKRTYGSAGAGVDDLTAKSLQVSPITVIAIYVFDWSTDLLQVGANSGSTSLALGPGAFWVLVVIAAAVPVLAAARGLPVWRRDSMLLLAGAAPAVSWWILGKSHAYTATPVCFVLWYLVFVPLLLWIIGAAATRTVRTTLLPLLERNAGPIERARTPIDVGRSEPRDDHPTGRASRRRLNT